MLSARGKNMHLGIRRQMNEIYFSVAAPAGNGRGQRQLVRRGRNVWIWHDLNIFPLSRCPLLVDLWQLRRKFKDVDRPKRLFDANGQSVAGSIVINGILQAGEK